MANREKLREHVKPQVRYTNNKDHKYGYFQSVDDLRGKTEEIMPNSGLPSQGVIQLRLADDDETIFE